MSKVISIEKYKVKKKCLGLVYFVRRMSIKGAFIAHPWQEHLLKELDKRYAKNT